MTTLSFNNAAGTSTFFANTAPRQSFAARLAVLQARQEAQAPHLRHVFGAAARMALALVPAGALAWLFVFV